MKEKKKQRPLLIGDVLYKEAIERANSMGLSFASYIRMLIHEDVKKHIHEKK